jgi:hypothetical protein
MLSLLDTKEFTGLDENAAKTLVTLCLLEKTPKFKDAEHEFHHEMMNNDIMYRMLVNRLEVFSPDTTVSTTALALVSTIAGKPGILVMWAYTLHLIARKFPTPRVLTIADITQMFPTGFPTSSEYKRIWDSQKAATLGSNLLDFRETWDAVPSV